MTLADKLKNMKNPHASRPPLWQGPSGDGLNGGITQGLISRFLTCRERLRILVVDGIKPDEGFSPRKDYGNMWHACEEALAASGIDPRKAGNVEAHIRPLLAITNAYRREHPLSQEIIAHWYSLCKAFFPLYVSHWASHPDVLERTSLLQEECFDVPYPLPSGRTVRLRGKWDSVDLIGKGKAAGIWLQENKTKSTINQGKLLMELGSGFELQTMFYLTALTLHARNHSLRDQARAVGAGDAVPIRGVRYNVIRRPAHKSVESALKKYHEDVENNRVGEWFARFKVSVGSDVIQRFRTQCLDPILEQLCDWWDHMVYQPINSGSYIQRPADMLFANSHDTEGNPIASPHWRTPYHYNPIEEGAGTDTDHYIEDGSMAGMQRTTTLFPELAPNIQGGS